VEGGTANAYVYALDPINGDDYSGMQSLSDFLVSALRYTPPLFAKVAAINSATTARAVSTVPFKKIDSTTTPIAIPKGLFIDKAVWKNDTLRVYPTTFGRYVWGPYHQEMGEMAWTEVIIRAPAADTPGMRDQFFCHWDFVRLPIKDVGAPHKESWNLDSNRPSIGYWPTVMHRCNP
jgi:hypothetical protein